MTIDPRSKCLYIDNLIALAEETGVPCLQVDAQEWVSYLKEAPRDRRVELIMDLNDPLAVACLILPERMVSIHLKPFNNPQLFWDLLRA